MHWIVLCIPKVYSQKGKPLGVARIVTATASASREQELAALRHQRLLRVPLLLPGSTKKPTPVNRMTTMALHIPLFMKSLVCSDI